MKELGELEKRREEFARRQVRVVAISNDDEATAKKSQADLPHLTFVADKDQKMSKAMQVIHAGAGPGGTDTNAPTTFLVDGAGKVRWLFRADNFVERAEPDVVLAAIDKAFSAVRGNEEPYGLRALASRSRRSCFAMKSVRAFQLPSSRYLRRC